MTLPIHKLRLIEHARVVGCYPAYEGTQGQHWCDEMVEMGLLTKRGVYQLDYDIPHSMHAAKVDTLHVYDTTVDGRELIGKPYPNDPTGIADQERAREYEADEMFGQF